MPHIVRFDGFQVDLENRQLHKHGLRIKLRDQSFQVLTSLLEHPGQVVTREALRRRLWRDDVFVDFDNNLNIAVARLRTVLGDSVEHPRFIETLPKLGYRFVNSVERVESATAPEPTRTPAAPPSYVPWVAVAAVVMIAVAGYVVWRGHHDHVPTGQRIMLAVLPLANLSGNPEQEFLAAGLTDEIITELGRLNPRRLGVIARTSVMRYQGTQKTVAEIGKELGVDFVVAGGAQPVERRLRVTMQLVRVSDQTHVWANSFDRTLQDVLAVERNIAQQTARALSVEL